MNLKGPNILGKIDLSKIERKPRVNLEKVSLILNDKIEAMSQELNDSFGPIFNSDASIKMRGKDASWHQDIVSQKEEIWAKDSRMSVEDWKKKREFNPATMAEKLVTCLLQDKLKDSFVVARSSVYDDYENGVDYVLMDKKSGAVVCGFDQVLGMGADDGSDKKKAKMERVLRRGGARLEYGLALDDDKKVVLKKLRNVPAFFLGISKKDLDQALSDLSSGTENNLASDLLRKMVQSLEEQKEEAQALLSQMSDERKYQELMNNINNFKNSLDLIKAQI